jgi:formylglycine-generating enzyme required for sulfatase activity
MASYGTLLAVVMAIVLVSTAGLVFFSSEGGKDQIGTLLGGGADGATTPSPIPTKVPLTTPPPIVPDSLEESLAVESAVAGREGVLVEGTCSPNGVAAILVDGRPAIRSPAGDRFEAVVPFDGAAVTVEGVGIDGSTVRRSLQVSMPESHAGDPDRQIAVRRPADGQTVHRRRLRIEVGSDQRNQGGIRSAEVSLDRIENRIVLGASHYTFFVAPEGLVYLRTNSRGYRTFLRESDGQEVVLIPAGLARRGTGSEPPHGPAHTVRMRPFLIDRTEVTCARYAAFLQYMQLVRDTAVRHPEDPGSDLVPLGWEGSTPPAGTEHHPVTGVTWYAAFAYARWVGGRLPTEAEWERAAAGPLGQPFPWGDRLDTENCRSGAEGPVAADSLPEGEGPCGLLHSSGNAREWCGDRFDPRWYLRSSRNNPRGPSGTLHRVTRGGSFGSPLQALALQHRDHAPPDSKPSDTGFRVAMRWLPPKANCDD